MLFFFCFESFMSPLTETDADKLGRVSATGQHGSATGQLIPTSKTGSLLKFNYTIKRGSVSDRLFQLDSLDPLPKPAKPVKSAPPVAEIGTEDVYEVEAILEKRQSGKKTEYLIKWFDWPAATNTWEMKSRIDPLLVAA